MLSLAVRRLGSAQIRSAISKRDYQAIPEGWPGSTVPFNIHQNHWLLCIKTLAYLCPPWWLPWFVMQYHLKKANPGYVNPAKAK